jgi:hypothetical protein
MYVRFLHDLRPRFRAGQCIELHERDGSHYLAGGMAELVTADVVRAYEARMELIDRIVAEHVNEMPARITNDRKADEARTGRREITQDEWHRELGQDQPHYWQRAAAHRQAQKLATPDCRHHN